VLRSIDKKVVGVFVRFFVRRFTHRACLSPLDLWTACLPLTISASRTHMTRAHTHSHTHHAATAWILVVPNCFTTNAQGMWVS
jgi:hypothetical protein